MEASDRAAIALRREEAKSRLVGTDKVFLLEGWLPADRCAEIEKTLEPFTCAIETREPTEDEYPQVPRWWLLCWRTEYSSPSSIRCG